MCLVFLIDNLLGNLENHLLTGSFFPHSFLVRHLPETMDTTSPGQISP